MRRLGLLFLIALFPLVSAGAQKPRAGAGNQSFDAFLVRWERAQTAFINGDPTLWKANASHRADVSIFGAFGGSEKGWDKVGPRNDWASRQFKSSGGSEKIEYLNKIKGSDIAVTVAIERQTAWIATQPAPSVRALRVTQVFRREGGQWKLVHRHADPLVERLPPEQRR